ncbi:hypothetical protein VOLCADRAFT_92628 [Volvox carteri f. nagariensis]|uniref:Uncharacterized protein n=1 Tax=Volvox carteri f. nagariensis TaxID=3068 RepID=D8U052_VOLCA|nr:uncharacterized protein VOLCADRAFT_92628 [Volvox carteri f. nagariensis]EFJ46877.1 hypothetical protein VOLCADRAFT_92628 [Volvox carteri f. nagariensis]|eukprot:XP_002952086.1 hypothetical protein VOLCADRAFT_92628 [Volvox carteri f. nagariensis]
MKSWEAKQPKPTILSIAQGLVQQYALPVAVVAYLVRRYLANKKKAAGKSDPKPSAQKTETARETRKPSRNYKVKREQEGPLLVGADDEDVEVQPHDDVMDAYDEKEVEKAGAASAGPGGGNTAMLQMLQQMGYRIIMPKDGSGQVFLVPPGAPGPGGQAIAEGDDEGYDEDEEGYEEEEGED